MKKLLLTAILTIGLIIGVNAQSGWSSGNYYAYKGQTTTETTYNVEYNQFCNCYVNVRYCRSLTWYQEWYAGYINLWNANGYWYTEWRQGTYWYCTWSNWWAC